MNIAIGILIPFFGTSIGSAMVYFMKNKMNNKIEKILLGFAAGVMIAASVWSLIIPSIEMVSDTNIIKWLPATVGFLGGMFFLYFINAEKLSKILNINLDKSKEKNNKDQNKLKKTLMMIFAVTLHNIPEGMAVGVIFAGAISGSSGISMAGAFALAVGIAIQNFPEGAIISMPLKSQGVSKNKSFMYGELSRNSRANWRCYYTYSNQSNNMHTSIFVIICCWSNDICCIRRAHTRISRRGKLKHCNYWNSNRIYTNDDS